MEFFTTKYINMIIKDQYLDFIEKYYSDILSNPNKYIAMTEERIAEYLGGGYVKLLGSGTTALQFGLLSLGVGPGDEVILPANTYSATAIAVTNIGAIPVFCDIRLDTFTLCATDMENRITPKTKAIIPVHLYGYNCEMDDILSIARKRAIPVLEDASHAFGGEYRGEKLGTIGDVGAFSCHVSKNFGTFGNGGIFYTKNESIFDRVNRYIFPDSQDREVLRSGRTPANISAMDAVVLLLKLPHMNTVMARNLELYVSYLEKYKDHGFVFPKLDLENNKLHLRNFVVLSKERKKYIDRELGKQYYNLDLSNGGIFGSHSTLKNTKKFFEENLGINFYFGKDMSGR